MTTEKTRERFFSRIPGLLGFKFLSAFFSTRHLTFSVFAKPGIWKWNLGLKYFLPLSLSLSLTHTHMLPLTHTQNAQHVHVHWRLFKQEDPLPLAHTHTHFLSFLQSKWFKIKFLLSVSIFESWNENHVLWWICYFNFRNWLARLIVLLRYYHWLLKGESLVLDEK